MSRRVFWQNRAIVYQIYPMSFYDANHDGIGDLQGIIAKLDYLKDLGVDVIWLSPVYASPMDDNGYDISDYDRINPIFGTMDDFDKLLKEVHSKGMKLIMDLVINHTSDEHPWFQASRIDKGNPFRDFYIWRDAPNDIGSVFSGSAWEWDHRTGQYYFHLFGKKQPDLNWKNPRLRETIYAMINRWLNKGIDGFRLDVIDLIGKDVDHQLLADGPFLFQNLQELHDRCFKGRELLTVGEMPGMSVERSRDVTSGNPPLLDMIFQFGHVGLDEIEGKGKWFLKKLDLIRFKQVFDSLQKTMHIEGWNSLFLANHDQPRAVSRYGSLRYRSESAKMLATILYGMQGTPFVYQGEEIGMTGIAFESIEDYRDVETKNMYDDFLSKGFDRDFIMRSIHAKSRDNSRTPMQWNDHAYAGFSQHQPWISVNPNYVEINVARDRSNPLGIFAYYRTLFSVRKRYNVFDLGDFTLVEPSHPSLFAYTRETETDILLVFGVFSDEDVVVDFSDFSELECLLANRTIGMLGAKTVLLPWTAGIYYGKKNTEEL